MTHYNTCHFNLETECISERGLWLWKLKYWASRFKAWIDQPEFLIIELPAQISHFLSVSSITVQMTSFLQQNRRWFLCIVVKSSSCCRIFFPTCFTRSVWHSPVVKKFANYKHIGIRMSKEWNKISAKEHCKLQKSQTGCEGNYNLHIFLSNFLLLEGRWRCQYWLTWVCFLSSEHLKQDPGNVYRKRVRDCLKQSEQDNPTERTSYQGLLT